MNGRAFLDAVEQLAWPAESGFTRALVLVIVAMFAWAMLCTLGHSARIARESRALSRAAGTLRKWRKLALEQKGGADDPAPFPRLSLEELAAKLAEIRRAAGANSHIAKLVAAIHTLRVHRMKVNLASLQQVVERDEATRPWISTPAYVANFAVMLGILGTFWGLGHMVTAIGEALPDRGITPSVESWATAVEQIRRVLSGMRTAFATSLVGMACSIGSGLASAHLRSAQQRLLQSLEEFAVKELLPATVPTLEDDSVLEQVSGQLERAFSQIDDIAQQNRQSLSELGAVQVVFRTIVEDIRAITHGDAKRDVTGVLEAVLGSNAAMQNLVAELPRLTQAVERATVPPPALHTPLSSLQPSPPPAPHTPRTPLPSLQPSPLQRSDRSAIAPASHERPRPKGFPRLYVAVLVGIAVLGLLAIARFL